MSTLLQISSGRGSAEVRRFVRLLADWLGARLAAEPRFTGDLETPLSAVLEVEADAAAPWIGTHQLVAPLRGKGGRKRWFVSVSAFEPPQRAPAPRLELSAARAGGPGGQNVNKRATAVRAVDRASGLAVRVSDQRSQAQNRAVAVARLSARIDARAAEVEASARASERAAHDRVVRGDAAFTWRLCDDGRLTGG